MTHQTRPRPEPVTPLPPGKRAQRVRAQRWQRFIDRLPVPGFIRKIIVLTVGGLVTIFGLIMVPLPGPGWIIVFAGLAILSTEFTWATRLKDAMKRLVDRCLVTLNSIRRDRRRKKFRSSARP